MKKFIINNWQYKVFSVVMAVLLWLYVSHQENPTTEQVITVPLEVRDLAQHLVIAERPSFVKVRLQGQRQDLDNIAPRDVYAFLALEGVDVGQHILEVKVSVPGKTRLVSVNPSTVNVKVEVVSHAQVPVVVTYVDNTPAKGFMALKPILEPSQVLVSGPEHKVKEVKQVFVEVDLKDSNVNFHQKLPAKVEDMEGNLMHGWIDLEPAEIKVLIPIVREMPSKSLTVKVPLAGEPAEGYKVERIVVEPELLTVFGEIAALNNVDFLTAEPVDVSGASQDVIRKVKVLVPEDLTMVEDPTVTVLVKIEKVLNKSFSGLTVEPRNAPAQSQVQLNPDQVDLELEGMENIIERLDLSDVKVFVDLSGLEPGEHRVLVRVNAPSNVTVKDIRPKEIVVKILEVQ